MFSLLDSSLIHTSLVPLRLTLQLNPFGWPRGRFSPELLLLRLRCNLARQTRNRLTVFISEGETRFALRIDVQFRAIAPLLIEENQRGRARCGHSESHTGAPGVRIVEGQVRLVVRRRRQAGKLTTVTAVNGYPIAALAGLAGKHPTRAVFVIEAH